MKKSVFFIAILFIISSCYGGLYYWREKLSVEKQDQRYNIKMLGLDVDKAWIDTTYKVAFFFYRDGIILRNGYDSSMTELQKEPETWSFCEVPFYSGVYKIFKDSIVLEGWVSTSGFDQYPALKLSGRLIEKNKMVLLSHYNKNIYGSDKKRMYTFRPYELGGYKPDSCIRWFRN